MGTVEQDTITNEVESEFLDSFRKGFRASYTGQIYDWAKDNVVLPIDYKPPGQFEARNSGYLIKPFEALHNPRVRQVNVMASPRSGKTLLGEVFMLYTIANNPGNLLWLQSTEKQSKKSQDTRMVKLLRMCKPVADLIDKSDRYAVTKDKFKFANGMTVHLGSWKLSDLQGQGYEVIVEDEVWQADTGLIAEAKARVGDFPDTHKILLISQGGVSGDDWSSEFNNAQIWEYGWTCPHCQKEQLFYFNKRRDDGTWAGLWWSPEAKINDQWDYKIAGESAELECFHCKGRIKDTPENRELLTNKTGKYLLTKDGDPIRQSFRWNALADPKVKWSSLAQEFLFASDVRHHEGKESEMEKFRQKRLALSLGEHEETPLVQLNDETYDVNAAWPEEKWRGLFCDVQAKRPKLWWLCRAAAANGESRLIERGTCETFDELEAVRQRLNVKHNRVFVDSGHDTHTVYTECVKHGKEINLGNGKKIWLSYIATKGDHKNEWEHMVNDKKIIKHHSTEKYQQINLTNDPKFKRVIGCPFYTFSNLHYKDLLNHLATGKGVKFLSGNVDDEYRKQMGSEIRVTEVKNGKTIHMWKKISEKARNEWWDLEVLAVFAMSLNNLIGLTLDQKLEFQALGNTSN